MKVSTLFVDAPELCTSGPIASLSLRTDPIMR